MTEYFFDQAWNNEKRRLDALASLYDEGTYERLRRAGIAAGWNCLELGAGSGTVARWMASRVGPTGKVVATDIDTRFLQPSAELPALEVRKHDIVNDPLEERAFDLIHARAVLQHTAHRDSVVAKLVRALKPGGWLMLEDIVVPQPICHPELPLWGKVLAAIGRGLANSGADSSFGIKLPHALASAGLLEIGSDARIPLLQSGKDSIEFVALSLEHAADKLVAAGALTAPEVKEALTAFRTPGRTMTAAIMIAAWGKNRG